MQQQQQQQLGQQQQPERQRGRRQQQRLLQQQDTSSEGIELEIRSGESPVLVGRVQQRSTVVHVFNLQVLSTVVLYM